MLLHKLRAAAHLAWLLVSANLVAVARGFARGPRAAARELRHTTIRVWLGFRAGLFWRGKFRVARVVRLCLASGVPRATLERNLEAAAALAERDIGRQKFEQAVETLTPHIDAAPDHPKAAKCHGLRSLAHIWHGHYLETIDDLNRCAVLRPRYARGFKYLANLAHVHGVRGDVEAARQAMAAQCGCPAGRDTVEYLAQYLTDRVYHYLRGLPLSGTVGVMIGAYHNAVGHAILDPFHFYNLFRHRFDHLVLIHPPLVTYSRPTLLMVSIMEQYLEQIEIECPDLPTFAWQNLGELRTRDRNGKLTFLCYNYWALNRMAFDARRDPSHPMSRGRKYVRLPGKLVDRAESLCRKMRIETDRPIVVLHTREHGYHRLRGQAFRNADVRNYIPAVRNLIARGFAVVRIGDRKMTSIARDVAGLIELPTMRDYDPVLDAYFLERCRFMISSQSGPCSLARAMGKPNLVVNGVYNHTTLPEHNELFAFKRYLDAGGAELGAEEAIRRCAHLFDRTEHFERAGIRLEDTTADEIEAAVEEMLAGLDDPDRPDTPAQARFRRLCEQLGAAPDPANPLTHRMSNYIGHALPECRVSDAVCRMRPGFVPATREATARVA
jgi:putative glycosyltransferase (TIGR04372 family)